MLSDNGTNLVGDEWELRELIEELDAGKIVASKGIKESNETSIHL